MSQQRKRVKIFDELKEGLEDALAYEQTKRVDLRTTTITAAPKGMSPGQIRAIRRSTPVGRCLPFC
jgi:DNA-binding transcriptional regulator YiaG